MEQSLPWEAKFPALYETLRFIALFTKSRLLSLTWARTVHFTISYLLKLYFNILFPSTPRTSKGVFPQVSAPKPCNAPLLPPTPRSSGPCPAPHILYNFITRHCIWWEAHIMKLSICSSPNPTSPQSLFNPRVFLNTPFSDIIILRVCPSLNVTHQVSHPYKIILLCYLILTLPDSHMETEHSTPDINKHFTSSIC
jgi:hypothetical protein